MKKQEQERINNYVLKNYDVFKDEKADEYWNYPRKQLRTCSAEVYETKDFIVLRSYNTIVAFYNKHTNEFFDVLRYVYGYTATSAQHISKFCADYGKRYAVNDYTYRDI